MTGLYFGQHHGRSCCSRFSAFVRDMTDAGVFHAVKRCAHVDCDIGTQCEWSVGVVCARVCGSLLDRGFTLSLQVEEVVTLIHKSIPKQCMISVVHSDGSTRVMLV